MSPYRDNLYAELRALNERLSQENAALSTELRRHQRTMAQAREIVANMSVVQRPHWLYALASPLTFVAWFFVGWLRLKLGL